MRTRRAVGIAGALAFVLLASGCVLPGFDKVDELGDDQVALVGAACGASMNLPAKCDACIRASCCEEATPCQPGTACGADMLKPITPVAEFSTDFDPLLQCMRAHCNAACSVDWGCLDKYEWPKLDGPVTRDVHVVPFLSNTPIAGVSVQSCSATDPTADCVTGGAHGVTNADGVVSLNLEPDFDGIYNFQKMGYLSGTARWSEPVHRLTGFTQFELAPFVLSAFAMRTGTQLDTSGSPEQRKGHLIARVQSCLPLRYSEPPTSAGAENVQVIVQDFDQPSRVFYTEPGNEVAVDRQHTSPTGYCGVFNLPPYYVNVRAVELEGNREIASARALVPPEGMAFIYLVPRSKQ